MFLNSVYISLLQNCNVSLFHPTSYLFFFILFSEFTNFKIVISNVLFGVSRSEVHFLIVLIARIFKLFCNNSFKYNKDITNFHTIFIYFKYNKPNTH